MRFKIEKSDAEWQAELAAKGAEPLAFEVTRRHGTERAFCGLLNDLDLPGRYHCICCEKPLFDATTRYDSGSGWPSYFAPIAPDAIGTRMDASLASRRTEVHCADCGAHLGHVFNDGPPPTGLRYCMNSASLHFHPA